ncbi:tyrosine-type recombinase/integrase [Octadecabacter arcticus]|uniref:tyrosine-type recombinase/integrase n=1 Tax=Octadecabacter arcticus TaxID=53946 RepID=UPI0009FF6FAF|nr:tyrosine-type recombinase/integrase [Octadecabacter arcticus]
MSFGWAAVFQQQFNQIRRQPSNHSNTRFSHSSSSHSGRRQFVTELADKGVNARVVQALARHKHLNTTMRYIDLNENKLRAAVELVSY